MTETIKEIYKASIKDTTFLKAIKEADNDTAPNIFASNNDKVIFATLYYGWLVGTYGNSWKTHIK